MPFPVTTKIVIKQLNGFSEVKSGTLNDTHTQKVDYNKCWVGGGKSGPALHILHGEFLN